MTVGRAIAIAVVAAWLAAPRASTAEEPPRGSQQSASTPADDPVRAGPAVPHERPADEPAPGRQAQPVETPAPRPPLGLPTSVQVNVGPGGGNIVGDAANEPSLAVDPTNPNRLSIGWRQFDDIASTSARRAVATARTAVAPGISPACSIPASSAAIRC